jgi:putative ABC transport system permease protein
VAHEFSFDRFHTRAERIGRLTTEFNTGDDINRFSVTGTRTGPEFYRNFPAVETFVRMMPATEIFKYDDKIFEEREVLYTDSTFLEVFTFPLTAGNEKNALSAPDGIVITESIAQKYFGDEDAIGKILIMNGEKNFMVRGVTRDNPENSHISFDFLVPFSNLEAAKKEEWFPANYFTYLMLHEENDMAELETRIDDYMRSFKGEEIDLNENEYLTFHLEPMTRIHLYSEFDGIVPKGNVDFLYILSIIGFLVLLIACINYTNLTTAQSASRQKEIGMRKVLGAKRFQLFNYFITESTLISFIAALIAFFISLKLLPLFNFLTGKSFSSEDLYDPAIIAGLVFITILIGLVSGIYPALILTRTQAGKILHSARDIKIAKGSTGRLLIVFQFIVSVFLIIATVIIYQQRKYIQNKDLGYDMENILVLPNDKQVRPYYKNLKEEFKLDPAVLDVSAGYDLPTFIRWTNSLRATTETGEKNFTTKAIPVDLDFLSTLNIQIIAGSDFTEADQKELDDATTREEYRTYYIINESALKELGWTAQEAIGQTITCGMAGEIKAVVKNFHIASLHSEITPLAIFLHPNFLNLIFVKIDGEDVPVTISRLESVWDKRISGRPFEYHFLDEDYNRLYKAEQYSGRIISTFTVLAIILASLGLFGLSAYMAVNRTREIGIRKVLGATVQEIVLLLSKEFIILVGIACLITMPVAWFAAREWLNGFVYRIDIQVWVFLLSGILAMLITILTVSYQSVKAARANPVDSLRNE